MKEIISENLDVDEGLELRDEVKEELTEYVSKKVRRFKACGSERCI